MEYLQLTLQDYMQEKQEIRNSLVSMTKNFVTVGWHLWRIDASGAYKNDGYKSVAEFAKAEYGMNASGVSRFIEVYQKYSVQGDTPELQEQYRDFKFSQLVDMLQLPEEDRQLVTPGTKREDIREIARFNRENENNPENLFNWQQEPGNKLQEAVRGFIDANKEAVSGLLAKNAGLKEVAETLNPSGNRSYRKGTVFLMMYGEEKGIIAKIFQQGNETLSWEEFWELVKQAGENPPVSENYGESADPDELPGQDNIMNHPEYMPGEAAGDGNEPEGAGKTADPAAGGNPPARENYRESGILEGRPAAGEPVPEELPNNGHQEIGFAPAQPKTEEQKYDAAQRAIDRQTKSKLAELEQEEKMAVLPSEQPQRVHQLREGLTSLQELLSGKRTFEICRNDTDYRVGDILEIRGFREGKFTGQSVSAEITFIMDEHTALDDKYCILALKRKGD